MGKQQLSKAEKEYIRAIVEEVIPKVADEAIKRAFISAVEKKQADRKLYLSRLRICFELKRLWRII